MWHQTCIFKGEFQSLHGCGGRGVLGGERGFQEKLLLVYEFKLDIT